MQEQKSARSYYDNGQLKRLTSYDGTTTPVEDHQLAYTAGGTLGGNYLNGNKAQDVFKLKRADGNTGCYASACTASWTYDARGRLIQEVTGTGTTTTYSLDGAGNVVGESDGTTATTRAFVPGSQQLTSVTVGSTTNRFLFDSYGNVDCVVDNSWQATSCPIAGNSALLSDSIYDYDNRLTGSRAYNGAGALTDSADYVNDPLDRPVKEVETHRKDNVDAGEITRYFTEDL